MTRQKCQTPRRFESKGCPPLKRPAQLRWPRPDAARLWSSSTATPPAESIERNRNSAHSTPATAPSRHRPVHLRNSGRNGMISSDSPPPVAVSGPLAVALADLADTGASARPNTVCGFSQVQTSGFAGRRPRSANSYGSECDGSNGGADDWTPYFQHGSGTPASARINDLAQPRERSQSAFNQRRCIVNEIAVHAASLRAQVLPTVPAPDKRHSTDGWRTAQEDGYRSAVFHAVVRLKELAASEGNLILDGHSENQGVRFPDAFKLRNACCFFDELSKIPNPLQEGLQFLLVEMCTCLFKGFQAGADVTALTPFFAVAYEVETKLAEKRRYCNELKANEATLLRRIAELESDLQSAQEQVEKGEGIIKAARLNDDSALEENNRLRTLANQLEESIGLKSAELREVCAESALAQGHLYTVSRDLDESKQAISLTTTLLSAKERQCDMLLRHVSDLRTALSLSKIASDDSALKAVKHLFEVPLPQLTSVLERELKMKSDANTRLAAKQTVVKVERSRDLGEGETTVDKEGNWPQQKLLRARFRDGGWHLVMRGSDKTNAGEILSAMAQKEGGRLGPQTAAPIIIASPIVFALLTISQHLPKPLEIDILSATDDEKTVREVCEEIKSLVQEHRLLIEVANGQRSDLKTLIGLCPQWNADEIRGLLKHVFAFDPEETTLVPPPVRGMIIIGLGEQSTIPRFLRHEGLLRYLEMPDQEILSRLKDVWYTRTMTQLKSSQDGSPCVALSDFIADNYLPSQSKERWEQMELSYNLFIGVWYLTSLFNPWSPGCFFGLEVTIVSAKGVPSYFSGGGEEGVSRSMGMLCLAFVPCEDGGQPNSKIQTSVDDAVNPHWGSTSTLHMYALGNDVAFAVFERGFDMVDRMIATGELRCKDFFPQGFDGLVPLNIPNADIQTASIQVKIAPVDRALHIASVPEVRDKAAAWGDNGDELSECLQRNDGKWALPSISFVASAEILYRGLLGQLNEDTFHDQTCMLVALARLLVALSERLGNVGQGGAGGLELSVLSAVLRMFFPTKPREHVGVLKRLLSQHKQRAEISETSTGDTICEERRSGLKIDPPMPTQPGVDESYVASTCIYLDQLLGVRTKSFGNPSQCAKDILQNPTPFVQELRRQHLIECCFFIDRVRTAGLAFLERSGRRAVSNKLRIKLTLKEADAALSTADRALTESQRHIYLLRGFGRRLPDSPSVHGVADSPSIVVPRKPGRENAGMCAARLSKVKLLLKSYIHSMHEESPIIDFDKFLYQIASSGVFKGPRAWDPSVDFNEVMAESGLHASRYNASAPTRHLQEFVDMYTAPNRNQLSALPEEELQGDESDGIQFHKYMADTGKCVLELSLAFPLLTLSYWIGE